MSTRKLEELFNLPPLNPGAESADTDSIAQTDAGQLQEIEDAIDISEKINMALSEVQGMDAHDNEMDEIAIKAIESYEQLMSLGMNMQDMAAGPVFSNAAAMLKIALEAKDSKVTRKLKQVDLMLKKARLDKSNAGKNPDDDPSEPAMGNMGRNEILALINQARKK